MNEQEIISKAYSVFRKYKIGQNLVVCKICCVSDEEEKALVSNPLQNLTSKQLYPYLDSARFFSDKELDETKHFLPRLIELVFDFQFPVHSVEITFSRLDSDQPEKWKPNEIELLNDFAVTFFQKCLQNYPLPINDDTQVFLAIGNIIVMFGTAFFDLKAILNTWQKTDDTNAILHFCDLLINDLRLNERNKVTGFRNSFSTEQTDAIFVEWLDQTEVQKFFKTKIENILLNTNDLTKEQQQKLSWCYEYF